jgi:tetrahedral aminopeptidase
MDTFSLLKQLTETPGPSGGETPAGDTILEHWRPLTDDVFVDRLGTVLATKHGTDFSEADKTRPTLLLAAHADELGLMVARIVEHKGHGFIRVTELGGVDWRQLFGQIVTIHGRQSIPAVLGGLPDHMLPEKEHKQAYNPETLVADPGLPIEDLRALVSIGDFISFQQPLRKLLNGRAAGKALDNRTSVAAVTNCLEILNERRHYWNVVAAATAQEETRLLGAYTSAYNLMPDAAVAIDVTHAKGPGTNDSELFELGSGPVLGIGSNIHPGIYKALKEAAKAIELTVATQPHAFGSGTDAYAIQVTREGIPTGLISIPLRYMHTMVETVDMADIERTGRILAEFITRLDDHFLPDLKKELMRPDKKSPPADED